MLQIATDIPVAFAMGDKAPISLIRCRARDACSPAEPQPSGRILNPPLGTHDAMLLWPHRPPSTCLIVKKWRDVDARDAAEDIGFWLRESFGARVLFHESPDEEVRVDDSFERFDPSPREGDADAAAPAHSADMIDVVVTVGGDGTVLHCSGLFQQAMPPVVAVAFGSLGFVTAHSFKSCARVLRRIFDPEPYYVAGLLPRPAALTASADADADAGAGGGAGATVGALEALAGAGGPAGHAVSTSASACCSAAKCNSATCAASQRLAGRAHGHGHSAEKEKEKRHRVTVSLRMRLQVEVYRCGQRPEEGDAPQFSKVVLNELLLERGSSPYMASLDAYVDGEPLTTVNADGLIVATQTGSTAYALSAGGSISSPNTAAISMVPICPHTLSFRPLLFPDSAVIRLEVPADARAAAYCAFDGRDQQRLNGGDFVIVRASSYPLPLVCRGTACGDWIRAMKCKLYWNVRERQKPLNKGAAGGGAATGRSGAPTGLPRPRPRGSTSASASIGVPAALPSPGTCEVCVDEDDDDADLYGEDHYEDHFHSSMVVGMGAGTGTGAGQATATSASATPLGTASTGSAASAAMPASPLPRLVIPPQRSPASVAASASPAGSVASSVAGTASGAVPSAAGAEDAVGLGFGQAGGAGGGGGDLVVSTNGSRPRIRYFRSPQVASGASASSSVRAGAFGHGDADGGVTGSLKESDTGKSAAALVHVAAPAGAAADATLPPELSSKVEADAPAVVSAPESAAGSETDAADASGGTSLGFRSTQLLQRLNSAVSAASASDVDAGLAASASASATATAAAAGPGVAVSADAPAPPRFRSESHYDSHEHANADRHERHEHHHHHHRPGELQLRSPGLCELGGLLDRAIEESEESEAAEARRFRRASPGPGTGSGSVSGGGGGGGSAGRLPSLSRQGSLRAQQLAQSHAARVGHGQSHHHDGDGAGAGGGDHGHR